jgi:23S rRNA pseudouridine1911/1915/1917 synthase
MAFTSGTKLGPYKILAPLGAGGMGEVYQARDTRLDRTVASKILPSHLSDDPTRRQRFEREAYTAFYQVSSLFVSEGKLDRPQFAHLPSSKYDSYQDWVRIGVYVSVKFPSMKKFPKKSRSRNAKPTRTSARPPSPRETSKTKDNRRKPRFSLNLSILYEDDALIIIDKPSGLLAVPIPGSQTPSAWSLLAERLEKKKQKALIVHRIDRFSSGALLFAKTAVDRAALVRQFLDHTPERHYIAALRGRVELKSDTLVHYFRKEGMYQQLRSAKDPEATRAELRYSIDRLFTNATLVKIELVTGLQNQIRAQFSALGHPVIGDRKFHPAEANETRIDRVALHAAHLKFVHPRSKKLISVDCKLPPDFNHLIRELSRPA